MTYAAVDAITSNGLATVALDKRIVNAKMNTVIMTRRFTLSTTNWRAHMGPRSNSNPDVIMMPYVTPSIFVLL